MTSAESSAESSAKSVEERRFILLGVLLQTLHIFFGVTAFFGMFLNTTRLPTLKSSLSQDHCRWQITTFWVGTLLYAITLTIGFSASIWWPFVLAVMWVSYRIISSAIGVATNTPASQWMWPFNLFNTREKKPS